MPQFFGKITVDGKLDYSAMLCSDADQSNSVSIHWWQGNGLGSAATFELSLIDNVTFALLPKLLYRSDANGGMFLPELTPREVDLIRNFSGTLTSMGEEGYTGVWTVPGEGAGTITLYGKDIGMIRPPLVPKVCESWDDFKRWADNLRILHPDSAFRGHGSNEWTLTTTINRAGRTRLERYYNETIQQFRTLAEVAMDRDFNLSSSADYATLLGLAQHHGLPSPLLDITDSPYVAAYFAFADAVENDRADESFVRIYAIAGDYIKYHAFPLVPIAGAKPYVASLVVPPRHNPRLYAQQGKFLVTNIVDLENFLIEISENAGLPILFAADVPVHCAFSALQDLKYMGLTAGTLFPGLDGVSRMMKQMMMINDKKHKLDLLPQVTSRLIDQRHSDNMTSSL